MIRQRKSRQVAAVFVSLNYKQFWIMSWTLSFVKDKWYKIKSQERWVRCCGKSMMKRVLDLDSVKEGFCSAHLHHGVGWLLLNHPLFIVLHILFDANPNKASRYFTGSLGHWLSGIHILCLALTLVSNVCAHIHIKWDALESGSDFEVSILSYPLHQQAH